jgi:hypothetical protein
MKKTIVLCATTVLLTFPALAWEKSFVVDKYEPAFYYGGKAGSTELPGSDCPKGTIPDNDVTQVLKTAWRSDKEIAEITKKVSDGGGGERVVSPAMSQRGFRKGIETYLNPHAAPDPGMQQVTGKIAEGFNLDGNAKTGGFTATSGEKGIDNGFYRAWGCIMSFRGSKWNAYLSQRANDKMLDGLYTMVVRVKGTGRDPMNDANVTVEIGYSPDQIVKDPNGNVTRDYSYRLAKSAQYTLFKGSVKKGVVETEQKDLNMPNFSWAETNRGNVLFQKGKLRFAINADGTMEGLAGGYRDWRDVYMRDTFNSPSDGATRETYYHQNQIGMYYALKRNADGMPDKDGQNTAISAAFRYTAIPAFVVDTRGSVEINQPPYPRGQRTVDRRKLFQQAQATRGIVTEQAAPQRRPENDDNDAPSADSIAGRPQIQASAAPAR